MLASMLPTSAAAARKLALALAAVTCLAAISLSAAPLDAAAGSTGGVSRRLLAVSASAGGSAGGAAQSRLVARTECLRKIQLELVNSFTTFLSNYTGKTAMVDVASLRDLGDAVLWLGAKRVFFHFEKTPTIICGISQDPGRHVQVCPEPRGLLESLGPTLTLFWHGGGNYGDVFWKNVHAKRMSYLAELEALLNNEPDFRNYNVTLVQLGSSVYYFAEEHMHNDAAEVQGLKKVKYILQTRQPEAYKVVHEGYPLPRYEDEPSAQASVQDNIDMVYALGPQTSLYVPRVDILLFIREYGNSESQWMPKEKVLETAGKALADLGPLRLPDGTMRQLTYEMTDWLDEDEHFFHRTDQPTDLSDVRLQTAYRILSRGHVMITNRLHASVLAALADLPCYWFNGQGSMHGYSKLSGTNARAWAVAPELCTPDVLRSWAVEPTDNNKEMGTLDHAVRRAYAFLKESADRGVWPPTA